MSETRLLRTYEHVAHKHHWCDTCTRQIMPGDIYKGIVQIYNGKFIVFKMHLEPPCDPEFDDGDLLHELAQQPTKQSLKMAA